MRPFRTSCTQPSPAWPMKASDSTMSTASKETQSSTRRRRAKAWASREATEKAVRNMPKSA
jgi:hypothetical protein